SLAATSPAAIPALSLHDALPISFGGGGALVAAAEEADREFALRLRRGDSYVVGGDRGVGCDVPDDLRVRLDEVGVAVGRAVQRVEGLLGEGDLLPFGGGEQGAVGRLAVEPVDAGVAEQALGVGLAGRQDGR